MKNSAFRKLFPEWTEAHEMRAKAEEAEEKLLQEQRQGAIGAGPESLGGGKAEGGANVAAEGEAMAGREKGAKKGSKGPPPPSHDSSPLLTIAVIVAVVFAIAAAVSGAARWR